MRTAIGLFLRILFTLALISLSVPAYSANVSWMNPSGGNWNNGANWSTGTVPGVDDIVYINYTGTYAVVLDMNPTIKGLVLGNIFGEQQKLICTSWELTVNGSVTIEEYGYLDLNTSAVHTSGDYILTNDGTLDIYNSSIEHKIQNTGDMLLQKTCSFSRSYLNDTTGTMTLEGTSETSCQLTVDTNFTNRGVIDLTSSWPVTATTATLVLNKGWLVNEPTGEINALLGSSFNNTSTRWLYAAITNQGTITAVGAGLGIYKIDAVHTNTGTYYAQGGTISFSQSGTGSTFDNTGTIQTDTGVGFYFNSDTFTWPSGTITNNGTLGFLGTDITFTPKYTNPGRIEMNGAGTVLNLTDTLFNDGTLYMTNGTVDGSVPIINNDSIVFQIGTINVDVHNNGVMRATNSANINGTLTTTTSSKIIPEAQTMNDVFFTVDQGFVNHGEILLTQAAQHNSYIVVPLAEDTLYNASDGIITSAAGEGAIAGTRYIAATLYNEGTVNVDDALLRVFLTGAPHTNVGTINVTGRDLQFTGNFANQGTINVAADKYLTFTGKTFQLGNGNLVGPGYVSFTSDTLYINGACTSSVDLMIAPIKAVISGTLLNNGIADILGLTVVGSGSIVNKNDLTIQSCTIAPDLDNQGKLTALKTTSVTGAFSNGINDTLIILAQSGGSSNMTVASSFTNYGDIILTSDVADDTHLSTLSLTAGSITNSSSGTITADLGSSTGGSRRLYAALNNQGTIQNKNINLIIEKSGANHLNSGTFEVLSGQVDLNLTGVGSFTNNGTIHFSNLQTLIVDQGTFNNNTTGTITGNGSLNLYATTFANDGWVEPGDSPGTINMQANNFVMDANAQIRIELGGTTPITEHDRVYCTQNANLGGVMNIEFIDDFIPAVNDSFLVLNYTTRIGDFLGILGLNQMGVELDTNFTASGLYLVARTVTNLPPVITGMPDSVSFAGDTSTLLGIWNYVSDDHTSDSNHVYDFTVDNDSLNYELNAAGFLILTADTGFSGTVTLGMTVTDQHGASSSDTTIVTVTDPNTAPVIAGMPPVTAMDADDSFNLGVWGWVTDAESHDSLLDYHFTSSNDSLVFAYDTSLGYVAISSISGYNDSAWLVLLVTDPGGKTATDSTLYVITYNFAPVLSGLDDSVTFRTDSTLTIDMHAAVSDAEEADADLVYTFVSGNDSLDYAWVSLSGTLDLFTSNNWSGASTVIATVTDSGGKQAVDTIVVTVTPVPNTAPTLTALADSVTFQTDANLIVDIWAAAADAESDDSLLTYGFTDNNDSLDQAWSDSTGQLTLTATNGYTGTAELYVTVTDPGALSVTDTVIVVVTDIPNTPPVVAGLPDTSLACDQALVVGLWDYVADAETTDSLLTFTFGYESDSTVGVFDTTTGELSLTVVGGYSGTSDVYVTVTDPLAASGVDTFEVTFTNIAPTVNLPDTISFDADTSYVLDYFSLVSDNDPDSTLYFAFSASNDSLERSYDTEAGLLTLSATSGFSGQVFLYLTVTDPDTVLAHDTCVVWVLPSLGVGDEDDGNVPDDYTLAQNYPNPFNPSTAIEYALPEQSHVTLVVFNVLGQEMQVLVDEVQSAGNHIAFWDGIDYHGQAAASGVYFYRIQAGPFNLTKKMVLIK